MRELAGAEAGDRVDASHDGRSLYLPDAIDTFGDAARDAGAYRATVLDQLGFREFGTYGFDLRTAMRRISGERARPLALPPLRDLPEPAGLRVAGDERQADLGLFFAAFDVPELARAVFRIVETARVRSAVARRYPGSRRYRQIAPADALARALGALPARAPLLPLAVDALAPDADVYTSAAATVACMAHMEAAATPSAAADAVEAPLEWLQREARLEDWEDELADVDSQIAVLEFAQDNGEPVRAGDAEELGGDVRDVDADLLAQRELLARRDRLQRRIDMERSSVRRALGEERGGESFRYDEWDHAQGVYLRGWCRLYEERLHAVADRDSEQLRDAVRPHAAAVRRRFEHIRPSGYQRAKRMQDGDELDLEAVVGARIDVRNGSPPDERVYSRRERLRRDVAAALLVDLSASTDDVVAEESEEPRPAAASAQDIRDPYFDEDDEYDFAARMAEDAAKRRIIDIQREAVLLLATALEGIGDRYGVYGFSGYGRDAVEFYIAKEFDEPFDQGALDAIAAMKPKRSTRMGPAIRHGARKLMACGAALKVMMVVSDGFPQDHDYGPRRGDHEYGVQDTAKALREAAAQGIETFCVTVDRSGHDYLRRMCPDDRYMVIEETAELPTALQKAYRQLTRL